MLRLIFFFQGRILPTSLLLGIQAVYTLLPHGLIHKSESPGSVPIVRQERNAFAKATECATALFHSLLCDVTVFRQASIGIIDAGSLPINPACIGRDQWCQFIDQFRAGTFRQFLHVQYQIGQSRYLNGGWRFGTRHIVARYHRSREANSLSWIPWYSLGMDAYTMTNGKTNISSIEHGHCLLFVRLPVSSQKRASLEDRCAIGSFNRQFRLKDPGLIAALLRFALFVHQK